MDTSSLKYVFVIATLPVLLALTIEENDNTTSQSLGDDLYPHLYPECQTESTKCEADFNRAFSQPQNVAGYCTSARGYITCVRNLACESEINLRLAYRSAQNKLVERNVQCELGVFPGNRTNKPIACTNKVDECAFSYVDVLLKNHTDPTNHNTTMLCQELDTFGSCLLHIDTCDSGKEEVVKTINDEKIRLKMPECETPSVNQGVRTSVAIYLVTLLAALATRGSMF